MADTPELLCEGPEDAPLTLAVAHGAGAGMDSPFLTRFAAGIAAGGFRVARFEFPYMAARRKDGKRRPPDRQPVLLDTWRRAIAALGGPERLVIGGRSMGGRMASMLADEEGVRGLVCLGYPFHPPGKPENLRTAHLESLATPCLICQGERDAFGGKPEVPTYRLSPSIELFWLPDGDHGLEPRKASGHTTEGNWSATVSAVLAFLERRTP
ncbi:MAG: alpha/beta family hydrolase [Pseudomonadota bacterium]